MWMLWFELPAYSAALNKILNRCCSLSIPYDPHLNTYCSHGNYLSLYNYLSGSYLLIIFITWGTMNILVGSHNSSIVHEVAHCVGHQSHSSYCLPLPNLYHLGSSSDDVALARREGGIQFIIMLANSWNLSSIYITVRYRVQGMWLGDQSPEAIPSPIHSENATKSRRVFRNVNPIGRGI